VLPYIIHDIVYCVCGGRLWAEIFEVQEENGDICWGRVSDDVVPVNITCVQSQPSTVFQITAYNRHVEKIFDVHIIQPGAYSVNIQFNDNTSFTYYDQELSHIATRLVVLVATS